MFHFVKVPTYFTIKIFTQGHMYVHISIPHDFCHKGELQMNSSLKTYLKFSKCKLRQKTAEKIYYEKGL